MPALLASFELSVADDTQLPAGGLPEVALLGRSNVGKSSLLNRLLGRDLAHTSKTPGRTRLLNFFRVELPGAFLPAKNQRTTAALYLVDLPGYGYARVPGEMRRQWPALIEPYLEKRVPLALAVLLIDAMVIPQAPDLDLYRWLARRNRAVQLVATKCDRLSGNQRSVALRRLEDAFGAAPLPFSARTGDGRDALWRKIGEHIFAPSTRLNPSL